MISLDFLIHPLALFSCILFSVFGVSTPYLTPPCSPVRTQDTASKRDLWVGGWAPEGVERLFDCNFWERR